MTTASKITLARVALIPIFMAVLLMGYSWAAMIIFAIASLTDFVDGYIARQNTLHILIGGELAATHAFEIWVYHRLTLHAIGDVKCAVVVCIEILFLVVLYLSI